jgi:hypothetical protein
MSADWNTVKEAFTSGMRAARVNPAATSCCLTVWMNAARSTLTVSPWTVMVSPWPVRALTSSSWATRLACTHASANAWLWTILATWEWVKLSTPLSIGPASAGSRSATCGGSPPRLASAFTVWVTSPSTSM